MDSTTDNSSGTKFGDLKKDECYKRLERNLKLAFVQQMEQAKAYIDKGYCTSPTWPSLSTINVDNFDTTIGTGNPSLQVSRVESEVVSSSSNLRKVLAMKKNISKPLVTSSVKQFPIKNVDQDRNIMPPPPPVNSMYRQTKLTSSCKSKQSMLDLHNRISDLESESHNSPLKLSSAISLTSEENSITPNLKNHKVFYRWRVLLNDQKQLIIKGTIDSGQIARSKPVIQRLSSNKVQSVYKHIYILEGSIIDDRNELPDYVRGKFYNGFPDDWENVYQIWRNYVDEGCKVTFRWPTPIADSDDDLITEITDLTYFKNKQTSYKELINKTISISNNASSSGYHSKNYSDSNQNLEKSSEEKPVSNICEIDHTSERKNNSDHKIEVKNTNASKEDDSNQLKDSFNTSINCSKLKYTSYLYEIMREDKLQVIRSNLANKNCPPEYLDKFIEFIDCLRYLLSFTPNNETDIRNELPSKSQNQNCQKCNSTASFSETQEVNQNEGNNILDANEPTKAGCSNNNAKYFKPIQQMKSYMHNDNQIGHNQEIASDSSDSEVYMGIPTVPVNRILQANSLRHERFRDVKNRLKDKKNLHKNQDVQSDPKIVADRKLQDVNNSSISISEGELEVRHQGNYEEQFSDRFVSIKQINTDKSVVTENKTNDFAKQGNIINAESKVANVRNSRLMSNKRSADRPKPIIKSNELVNINLQFRSQPKNQLLQHSDVSLIDDEISTKRQKLSVDHNDSYEAHNNDTNSEDKTAKDLLQHRFITYDSEDFPDGEDEAQVQPSIKTKSNLEKRILEVKQDQVENVKVLEASTKSQDKVKKNESDLKPMSPSKRNKTSKDKTTKKEPFGSKENPKLLTLWVPCVVYNDELKKNCSLKFEGKLINEAGHILNRKFTTDVVLKRHSSTLIETVKNEFFMLIGELNNTKHVVPKELLKQCRTGCPVKIKNFCEEWKHYSTVLEKPGAIENLQNTSIDCLSVPTSSRGRRILPPLNYWDGERVVTKDDDTVYDPGDVGKTSSLSKLAENIKYVTPKGNLPNKKSTSTKNSSTKKSSSKSTKIESKSSNLESTSKQKKQVVQQIQFSDDSSENEADKVREGSSKLSSKKSSNLELKSPSTRSREQVSTESAYNTKLRKRQKLNYKQSAEQTSEAHKAASRLKKPTSDILWTYEKQKNHQDVLSDDQSSVIFK